MDFMHLFIKGRWCSTELCENDIKMHIVRKINSLAPMSALRIIVLSHTPMSPSHIILHNTHVILLYTIHHTFSCCYTHAQCYLQVSVLFCFDLLV